MQKLNRTTANKTIKHPIKVMQFGGGNFLRAFCDWMFDTLNKTTDFNGSVAVIKPTERGDYSALKEQEGLFHVALDGFEKGQLISEITLVESVNLIIQPYTHWEAYLKLAEQPELRFIVSNTTEAGIKFSEEDKKSDSPPKEFPAKLTAWLYHRFNYFKGEKNKGCILLPCELIENNGDVLKETVLEYAKHWNLETAFISWVKENNYFCSTLVDRIVSGYPEARASEIIKQTGFNDNLLVAGEYYHSWIIKGNAIVQKELPFSQTNLNVQFVDSLSTYREMKVRILNGAHTSLVPVGYLASIKTVKDSMGDALVSNHIKQILSQEIKPTLTNHFKTLEIDAFIDAVLDRFKNPTLQHYLIDISLNSTSKFQARLLPAFKEYIALEGTFPKRIAFSLSCLLLFYKGHFNNQTIVIKDDAEILAIFKTEWDKVDQGEQTVLNLVKILLSNEKIVGEDLTTIEGLVETITNNINNIEALGVKESLKNL
ncbi:tagaturonate reductase [Aquimarina sp. BL5]|uniref:tagaturonate reductase n=1 Tax=Aquimarina sp. BL5 TaxID=1714860 RepID=UPI000E54714A|nr:tagaturonate reductase [Aquimarina sp. BL5]AXT50254.1 tagaturonate reductase [Aquimarina sp. BL5]RKN00160.1 tagaturonate reductase [Aquimarina sp. BL5]